MRVYVSVCLAAAACPHYCTVPDVTWGNGRGCHLVVHCWADLQSAHGLRCYGNITRNFSEYMLVIALCLVFLLWFQLRYSRLCWPPISFSTRTQTFLWSLYGIGQTIIFLPCGFFFLSFFFPRLISAVGDWMFAILPHMVWP